MKRSGSMAADRSRRCLAATALLAVAASSLSAQEPRRLTLDDLFPRDRVLDVRITVAEDDWDMLRRQTRTFASALAPGRKDRPPEPPYTYVKASVVIDGVAFPDVGVRKKGFIGSQSSTRPSLKVRLNHVDKSAGIGGLTLLTLNNNKQDTSLLSQTMGYAFFNRAGSPAPRCAHARVTVNGKNLGIYSHVESVRRQFLKRAFGTDEGTLYEGTVIDFFEGWENGFERKLGPDGPGRQKIVQLIQVLKGKDGVPVVAPGSAMRATVPTSGDHGDRWTAVEFDDSTWAQGKTGAGFDRQDTFRDHIGAGLDFKEQMYAEKRTSLYVRIPFEVDDPRRVSAAGRLVLRMKYDDGFVAYLNGHRVAAVNAPEQVAWDSTATVAHPDEAAVQFESLDVTAHAGKLRKGRNVLAIHGLNAHTASSDMLIAAALETNDFDMEKAIGEIVDLDSFYRFWAIESLLGFWDGYAGNKNNFFFFLSPETDKFHFVPWGADSLFTRMSWVDRTPNLPQSVKTVGLVAHKLYQLESGRKRYEKALRALLETHWNEERLHAEMDRLEAVLEEHRAAGQRGSGRALERQREFVRNRRAEILEEIKDGMPLWPKAPAPPFVMRGRGNGRDR